MDSPPTGGAEPGFDRRSLRVLLLFLLIGTTAGLIWSEHVSFSLEDLDPLLGACWIGMAALAIYRVHPRRDAPLAAVAFAGGALIEAWGTRSGLWTYFTQEQPPLFILPAWPAAALATERVAWFLDRRLPTNLRLPWPRMYGISVVLFALGLAWWTRPGWGHPLTWVAWGCVMVTAWTGDPAHRRADLVRFAAGALVGIPLEYWGTSRGCWTYWSGETPPPLAVLSHGFATVSFARGVSLLQTLARRTRLTHEERDRDRAWPAAAGVRAPGHGGDDPGATLRPEGGASRPRAGALSARCWRAGRDLL